MAAEDLRREIASTGSPDYCMLAVALALVVVAASRCAALCRAATPPPSRALRQRVTILRRHAVVSIGSPKRSTISPGRTLKPDGGNAVLRPRSRPAPPARRLQIARLQDAGLNGPRCRPCCRALREGGEGGRAIGCSAASPSLRFSIARVAAVDEHHAHRFAYPPTTGTRDIPVLEHEARSGTGTPRNSAQMSIIEAWLATSTRGRDQSTRPAPPPAAAPLRRGTAMAPSTTPAHAQRQAQAEQQAEQQLPPASSPAS